MSERLTDAALENLDAFLCAGGKLNNGIRDYLRAALAELRSARAAALTADEREALEYLRRLVGPSDSGLPGMVGAETIAVLDRLLNAGGNQ